MLTYELECGHRAPVKPENGCTWCPVCNALMAVIQTAA